MDKRKQNLFIFARMTPAEYKDDLQQMRIPGVDLQEIRSLDKLELRKPDTSLDGSD